MHRFYAPPEARAGECITLSAAESHHATRVLRLTRDSRVLVLDGIGSEWRCRVMEADHQATTLSVLEGHKIPRSTPLTTLFQGVTKGKSMEWIVQKATELGAFCIMPVLAERTVVRLDSARVESWRVKWRTAAIEAMKQCGAVWLPEIGTPGRVSEAAESARAECNLLASLQADARHPRTCLESFGLTHGRWPGSVGMWVGPEGDFTASERERIRAIGAWPVTLGALVLRSETAALYGLSVLRYEFQARDGKAGAAAVAGEV